jgi:hypothetical protein
MYASSFFLFFMKIISAQNNPLFFNLHCNSYPLTCPLGMSSRFTFQQRVFSITFFLESDIFSMSNFFPGTDIFSVAIFHVQSFICQTGRCRERSQRRADNAADDEL